MIRSYKIAGNSQIIQYEKKILNINCTCVHGSIKSDNWKRGENICWHLKSALALLKKENESRLQKKQ